MVTRTRHATSPEVLAIVQARGGSKGAPRKNLAPLDGFPLVAWPIAAAHASVLVTRLIISTDDPEIADTAERFGCRAPFLRPPELATDTATDYPLFKHALDTLRERENYTPDIVVQLRPTSPLRPRWLIDAAVEALVSDPQATCARTVTPAFNTPYKMWTPNPDTGRIDPLLTLDDVAEPFNAPRQSLPPVFWQTGHADAIRTATITEKNSLTGTVVRPVEVPRDCCVDIDTPHDLTLAQHVLDSLGHTLDLAHPRTIATTLNDGSLAA